MLAICLSFGLLVLPWLIWMMGQAALGPYSHGGAGRFFADFYGGLSQGAILFWIVAAGPYLFLLLIRLFWAAARPPR